MSTFNTMKETNSFLKSVKSPKQAVPVRTGIPYFVENNLTNTVDLHVAATNFINIVDDFSNELATFLAWEHTKSSNDPITSQIDFFKNLNNKLLSLKKDDKGGTDTKIKKTLTVAIDVNLKPGERIAFDTNGVPITQLKRNLRQYKVENTVTKVTRWVTVERDILNQVRQKTSKLKSKFGLKDMSDEFVVYWIDKFRTAHHLVQAAVLEGISDDDNYFQSLGDSIGSIARLDREAGWNLSSIDIPLNDIDYKQVGIIPVTHSPVIDDKIDPELKKECLSFSQKTSAVFRGNMSKLVKAVTKSSVSHGEDLVPDRGHWDRMTSNGEKSVVQDLNGRVGDVLGDVNRVLHYLRTCTDFNRQKVLNPKIEYAIEKSLIKVDVFKNMFEPTTKKVKNIDILGTKKSS